MDSDEIDRRFGARLAPLRALRRLSQQKLADRAGMPQSAISKIEAGLRSVGLGEALTLCDALHVDLLDMVRDGELQIVTVA